MRKSLTALMIALLVALSAGSAVAGAMDATNTNPPKVGWKKPSASKAEYATNAGKAAEADLATNATNATNAEKAKELDANATIFPSCGANQVLTVSGGVFSCVDMASGSSSVGECSASVTLVGGKTYAACCNAGGTVAQIGGGQAICKFSGSTCQSGWSAYLNWTTTTGSTAFGNSCNGQTYCTVSGHAFQNMATEYCGMRDHAQRSICGTECETCTDFQGYHYSNVTERGCT